MKNTSLDEYSSPADKLPTYVLDLSYWNITVPIDMNKSGKADTLGFRMEATLQVNHVSINAEHGDKPPVLTQKS